MSKGNSTGREKVFCDLGRVSELGRHEYINEALRDYMREWGK